MPTPETHSRDLIASMAERYSLEPEQFKRVIKATCGLMKASDEEFLAFLMIAHEHKLNPLTREIYAFVKAPERGGGIQPIIGVDGWYKKMNEHPAFDGLQFQDELQGGALVAVTAMIYRKDRTHPTQVTEYMHECKRNSDPWRQWPARMLRHKAAIQCIRIAFNLAGIMDPDEAERYAEMLEKQAKTIEVLQPDDMPVSSSGRVTPIAEKAAETSAVNTSPPHEVKRKRTVASPPPQTEPPAPEPPVDGLISEEDSDQLIRAGGMVGFGASRLKKYVQEKFGVGDLNELRQSQAEQLRADLRTRTAGQ